MSLDKAIFHKKERRKPYRGSKAFDPSCRNNTCHSCFSNVMNSTKKRIESAKTKEEV